MLRPENWEEFHREYDPTKYKISYWHTTEAWARRRGWVKGDTFYATLYVIRAIVIVVAIFWVASQLFEVSPDYLMAIVPLAALIGLFQGRDRAFKRSFVAMILSDKEAFRDAPIESGIDIYGPGEP